MQHNYSIRTSLIKRKQSLTFVLLLTFGLQAMFAKGLMAGQGTWVELCTSDSASLSLVYLGADGQPAESDHQDDEKQDCTFSAFAWDITDSAYVIAFVSTGIETRAHFSPFLSSQLRHFKRSRAPPVLA